MNKLIIMRGLPGSGKSTKAQLLVGDGKIYATDDYWGDDYAFDRARIGEAHEWNQQRVHEAIVAGVSPIVVDATNMQMWEMQPYVEFANAFNYDISFHESDAPWKFDAEELAQRNRHGVPIEIIKQMLMNWEKEPTVEKVLAAVRPKFGSWRDEE
jgi:NEDD4-binding protein 2